MQRKVDHISIPFHQVHCIGSIILIIWNCLAVRKILHVIENILAHEDGPNAMLCSSVNLQRIHIWWAWPLNLLSRNKQLLFCASFYLISSWEGYLYFVKQLWQNLIFSLHFFNKYVPGRYWSGQIPYVKHNKSCVVRKCRNKSYIHQMYWFLNQVQCN